MGATLAVGLVRTTSDVSLGIIGCYVKWGPNLIYGVYAVCIPCVYGEATVTPSWAPKRVWET
jgi:hypothetical protein